MKKLLALSLTAILATGCGLLSKSAPDEMAVIEGPALSLPPSFELRPPRELEQQAKQDQEMKSQELILGEVSRAPVVDSNSSESWLIQKAGGEVKQVDPNIRATLSAEAEKEDEENKKGFFSRQKDKLLGDDEE